MPYDNLVTVTKNGDTRYVTPNQAIGFEKSGFTIGANAPAGSEIGPVYGTQPQTNTQTSTTTPRPVYTTNSAYDKAAESLYTQPVAPSQEQIRQQEIDRANQLIEATRGVYESDLAKLQQQGKENLAQTSSIATSAGLAGSPFKQGQEQKTQDYTNQVVEARQAERQAQIAKFLTDANDNAEKKFQQERLNYESDREAYLGFLKDKQTSSRDAVLNMAKSGYKLDELDQTQFQQLLDNTGLSELELRALYDSNAPQPETSYQVQGDRIIMITKDPVTGAIKTSSEQIPGLEATTDGGYKAQISGNNLVLIPDKITSAEDIIIKPLGETSTTTDKTQTLGSSDTGYYEKNPDTGVWEQVIPGKSSTTETTAEQAKAQDLKERAADSAKQLLAKAVDSSGNATKDLKIFLGKSGSFFGSDFFYSGTPIADLKVQFNNLKSLLSLDNVSLLKGQGQVSDAERKTLSEASAKLDQSQTPEEFVEALQGISSSLNSSTSSIPEQDITDFMSEMNVDRATAEASLQQGIKDGTYKPSFNNEEQTSLKGKHNRERSTTINEPQQITNAMMSAYPEDSKGGQCTTFLHNIVDFPPIGDGLNAKKASIEKFGMSTEEWKQKPRIGDIIVTDENPTYGHTAVILDIKPNGDLILGESNYKRSETVSYGRAININSSRILGAFRGDLKI